MSSLTLKKICGLASLLIGLGGFSCAFAKENLKSTTSSLDFNEPIEQTVQWFKKKYPKISVVVKPSAQVYSIAQMQIKKTQKTIECVLWIGSVKSSLESFKTFEGQRAKWLGSEDLALQATVLHELGHCAFGVQALVSKQQSAHALFENRKFHEAYADIFSVHALQDLHGTQIALKALDFNEQQRKLASIEHYKIAPVLTALKDKGLMQEGNLCEKVWNAVLPFTQEKVEINEVCGLKR